MEHSSSSLPRRRKLPLCVGNGGGGGGEGALEEDLEDDLDDTLFFKWFLPPRRLPLLPVRLESNDRSGEGVRSLNTSARELELSQPMSSSLTR